MLTTRNPLSYHLPMKDDDNSLLSYSVATVCVEDKGTYTEGDEPEGAHYANEENREGFHFAYLLSLISGQGPVGCGAPQRWCERGGSLIGLWPRGVAVGAVATTTRISR